MRRRDFIRGVGGIAAAYSVPGRTVSAGPMRRVGALLAFAEDDPTTRSMMKSFDEALRRLGWTEGTNIRVDYRFAAGNPELFKTYAAELIGLAPDVILASTPPSVIALRQHTQSVPIVFVLVTDPVGLGFVESFAHPGGNITGFSFDPAIMGKWLQLLKEINPSMTRVIVIYNPDTNITANPLFNRTIEAAAPTLGLAVMLAPVHDDAGIDEAISAQSIHSGTGVIALPDSFNIAHGATLTSATRRHRLPLIGPPLLIRSGGLISYMFDPVDLYAQAASYIDRILKGTRPTELPVQQPTKFELVINLRTAREIGVAVPPPLLTQADQVVE